MLAVVVLNWNGGDDTRRCLESLALSTFPHRTYLVDNGSTDGSLNGLRPDVLIRNGRNLGFSGGCNAGARQALADGATHLFFLNNDATLAPDTLEKLHTALTEAVVAVSPRILTPPLDGGGSVWFERGQLSLHELVLARHVPATEPGVTDFCSGCALLVRATDFERVGGFDEALFAYYEDIDLCLKLGGVCRIVPEALAWHKGSASTGGSESPRSLFYTFRNSRAVALRHGTPDQQRQYRSGWLRQGLWLASFVGGRSKDAGAAALLGMLCAHLKPAGEMPRFPLWLLWPLALLNQKLPRRDRMTL